MVSKIDQKIKATLKSLSANNFEAKFAENGKAAKKMILNMIPNNAIIGVGDSATVRQICVLDELEGRGTKVINPFTRELTTNKSKSALRQEVKRKIFTSDVFIVSTNAVTLDGKLVNIDGVGNRVASMIFGPKKVIVVTGKNKIVKDVNEALYRIKNVIAPYHAKTKKIPTPCAVTGKCGDCNAARRICNVIAIIEKKPLWTEITVIIVDDDLGLSWDETWPSKRINRIKSNYDKVTWVFA